MRLAFMHPNCTLRSGDTSVPSSSSPPAWRCSAGTHLSASRCKITSDQGRAGQHACSGCSVARLCFGRERHTYPLRHLGYVIEKLYDSGPRAVWFSPVERVVSDR